MLEDGTCHRKRNVSVLDRRKPGETPLCKCGSLMLVFLGLPDGLHMQVDHSLCPWKPPFPAPWASLVSYFITHCLVLVFNKYYIFKHSSKFWGFCHKEERHCLWVSCCPIRSVSLSHLICIVTSVTTFHEDGEPWLKDPWLQHALWRTQKISFVWEFPRESLCSCFFFFNASWYNVMNYVWMAPNCVTDYIQFHHKLLIRFTPAEVPPGGSEARWVVG